MDEKQKHLDESPQVIIPFLKNYQQGIETSFKLRAPGRPSPGLLLGECRQFSLSSTVRFTPLEKKPSLVSSTFKTLPLSSVTRRILSSSFTGAFKPYLHSISGRDESMRARSDQGKNDSFGSGKCTASTLEIEDTRKVIGDSNRSDEGYTKT